MTDAPRPSLPPMERLVELFFDAARTGRDDMVPALLHAGVDIEATDARGHSALVLACYNGQEGAARALLDAGAAPDGRPDHPGHSALMGVAFKGFPTIARLLIERGADTNRQSASGQTALMMAALVDRGEIVDLLIAHGADPALADAQGNTAASLAAGQGNAALAERLARPGD